jgi:hypothetical protein
MRGLAEETGVAAEAAGHDGHRHDRPRRGRPGSLPHTLVAVIGTWQSGGGRRRRRRQVAWLTRDDIVEQGLPTARLCR